MRKMLWIALFSLALPFGACSQVNDLVDSVTGGGSDESSESTEGGSGDEAATDDGEATGEGGDDGNEPAAQTDEGAEDGAADGTPTPANTAAADGDAPEVNTAPSGLPVVEGRSMDAAFALVPADPTGVMALDAAALWAFYDALYGDFGAFLEPADIDELFAEFLVESDIPEAAANAIRVTELRDLVAAVWMEEESILLVVNASAVPEAPADGAAAETFVEPPLQVARRGDHVIFGFGAGFTNALTDGPRFSPSQWQAGWDALPENPAMMVFVPSLGDDPAAILREMDLPPGFEFTRAAAAIRTDGAIGIALDMADDAMIQQGLGAMALGTEQFIGSMREMVPPAYAGWVEYLDLGRRALLSQLTYERSGTVSSLSVPAAECGVQLALPIMIGAAYFGLEQSPGGDLGDVPPWQNVDVATATGCGPMSGPAPTIPRTLARLAPADPNTGGGMVLWDLSGMLRGALPTMGNLLPVALDHSAVAAALGPAPLGLNGLDDAEGSGALYMQMDANSGDGSAVLVAHRGVQSMIPAPSGVTAEVRDGVGFVIASPEMTARLDAPLDPTAPWPRAINALPANTVLAFGVDGGIASQSDEVPIPAVQAVINATQVAVMGITADYDAVGYVLVDGDAAALAAALEPGLRAFATQMLQSVPESEREFVEPLIDIYMEMFEFGHQGTDIVTVELSLPMDNALLRQSFLTGIGAAIAIPAFMQYRSRLAAEALDGSVAVEASTMLVGPPAQLIETVRAEAHRYYLTERLDDEGKALPMRFPESVSFAPSLAQMRDACAANGSAFVSNDDLMMYAATGWRELGIASYAPGSDVAVEFTSEGAGPNATYQITVRGDQDCDSVYSMFRTTGTVVNGVPVAGPVTEIEPNE